MRDAVHHRIHRRDRFAQEAFFASLDQVLLRDLLADPTGATLLALS